ncbi:MAG: formate dehydrogenase accessory sulfurtransferase FdhD [Desulfobulbaceae bacterium]|nr:MAG: formate dehydrogenase accessory sulfurtransferase FdhD [Desulfobulbaceae bacterium]
MTTEASISCTSTILTPAGNSEVEEQLAIETPYTISLNEIEIGASMVLPVGLEEFGVGFLFGQGYLSDPKEVKEVIVCPEGKISVYADVDEDVAPKDVIITSGCGGTGKIPRDMLEGKIDAPLETSLSFADISVFIRTVLHRSTLGPMTHCVHGCGIWSEGKVAAFYEDVGRHNAVDKIMGAILLGKASPRGAVYTTGRLTSDMVLKCARMRIPIVMSRTAPSTLGLAIAQRAGITLAAYARPERLNVFCNPNRISN